MNDSLKHKTSTSLFWNFIDKGGQQLIQLIFWFILLRMLEPSDFGLVALLAIFPIVANILQESGFTSALIRKKDADNTDYNSVFFFNTGTSIFLYIIFFFFAPAIATYYEVPALTDLSRVIFLTFIFNGFGLIQNAHLIKRMDFKTNTKITLIAGVISGCIAIFAAYSGYGVWSLVIQQVIHAFLRNLFLWIFIGWRPSATFSFDRLKTMIPYSFKLLATSIMNQVSAYIYPLIIGKYFSIAQVGYYSQAEKLNRLPQSIMSESIKGVAFPVMTKVDGSERIKRIFRKIVRVTSFVCFPIAAFIIIAAKPVVVLLLTDTYLQSIPILQILAICGVVFPLSGLTSSLLQVTGQSGKIFKIEAIRNILTISAIFITIYFGILWMVTGMAISYTIAFFAAYYISGKTIGYSLGEVLKDISPYLFIAIITFTPLYFLHFYISNNFILLSIQLITGSGIYVLACKFLGSKVIEDCIDFIKSKKQ